MTKQDVPRGDYFKRNFELLQTRSGLSWFEIARRADIDYATIYRMMNSKDGYSPRSRTRERLAYVFGVDANAMRNTLFDDETPMKVRDKGDLPQEDYQFNPERIPLAKSTYALDFLSILDDDLPSTDDGLFVTEKWLPPLPFQTKEDQRLIAIKAIGNALAPSILEGDLVYLDKVTERDVEDVKNGDFVLAVADSNPNGPRNIVLRKLVIDDMGQQWLMATNPDWPGQRSVACEQVVGVVIAIARQF